jgi:hypothetical protein
MSLKLSPSGSVAVPSVSTFKGCCTVVNYKTNIYAKLQLKYISSKLY